MIAIKSMACAPLQAQTTDQTEPESSPKKFPTDKLPAVQKVCDTDYYLDTIKYMYYLWWNLTASEKERTYKIVDCAFDILSGWVNILA